MKVSVGYEAYTTYSRLSQMIRSWGPETEMTMLGSRAKGWWWWSERCRLKPCPHWRL